VENIIKAISELWKLVGIIILGIAIIIFREPIKSILLKRNLKFKKGNTEIEVISNPSAIEEQTITKEQAVATIEKTLIENTSEEKDDSSSQFGRLFKAYSKRDIEELNKIIRDIDGSELDVNEKIRYKTIFYRMCYAIGDIDSSGKMEEFAYKHKESKENYIMILKSLAGMYMEANQYEKAFEIYKEAIDSSEDIKEKAELVSKSALCALDLKLNEKAISILIEAINSNKDKDALYVYYTNLATVYECLKENELKVLALEKALQYCTNNVKVIFDIAYSYNDKDIYNDLTLLHYNNLLKFEPNNGMALNNIGVVYSNLGLNGLKIDSYNKAIENRNSLASANIAYEYIEKGFYEKAKKILKEASDKEDPHINVSKALTHLNEVIQSEKEKEKEIISQAIIKQRFFNKYADAYFNISKNFNISNSFWKFGDNILEMKQVINEVEGKWSENKTDYKFKGNIFNQSIKGKVSKSNYEFITKTYQDKEIGIAYIYISNSNDKLYMLILENEKGKYTINEFEKFTKVE
jgi:tetratricopeptide (TPR) repeat protein